MRHLTFSENANLACQNSNAAIDDEEDPVNCSNLIEPNYFDMDVHCADETNVVQYKKLP